VGGPNTRKRNPRWRTAAILKNQKSSIGYLWYGSTDLREIWYDGAHWDSEPDRKLKFPTFKNPRWRTAATLKNGKSAIGPLNNIYYCEGLFVSKVP